MRVKSIEILSLKKDTLSKFSRRATNLATDLYYINPELAKVQTEIAKKLALNYLECIEDIRTEIDRLLKESK